ncbi:hypothetical protein BGY98DRAFT_940320, partial [Russula aff. rugulosa BPL654]
YIAAQSSTWQQLAPLITKGKTLYFSHGFSVVYKEDTKVVPPKDVDVISSPPRALAALSARSSRRAVASTRPSPCGRMSRQGKAKATAIGVAIGSGYMYETKDT